MLRQMILVRVSDLEPGQRVRMPRTTGRGLQTVVSVHETETGAWVLGTDLGAYVCEPADLVDTALDAGALEGLL